MKNIIILLFLAIFFIACDKKGTADKIKDTDPWSGKIIQHDSKSLAAKKFSEAYTTNNLASVKSLFTDDAIFHVNDSKLTIDQMMDGFSQGHEYFDNINHSDDIYTTMYYNNDSIFTNMWYTWSADSKKTGEKIVIRGYAWFKWQEDKIIEVYNAFDPTLYNAEMSDG